MKLKLNIHEFLKEAVDLRGASAGSSDEAVEKTLSGYEEILRSWLSKMAQLSFSKNTLSPQEWNRELINVDSALEILRNNLLSLHTPKANALAFTTTRNLTAFKQSVKTNTLFAPVYTASGFSPKGAEKELTVARQSAPSSPEYQQTVPTKPANTEKRPEPKISQNLVAFTPLPNTSKTRIELDRNR